MTDLEEIKQSLSIMTIDINTLKVDMAVIKSRYTLTNSEGLSKRVMSLELAQAKDKGFFVALGILASMVVSATIAFGSRLIGK